MKRSSARQLALIFFLLSGLIGGAADKLESDFSNPPADARPHTWWHWVNGNVTKEGIVLTVLVSSISFAHAGQSENVAPKPVTSERTLALDKRYLLLPVKTRAKDIPKRRASVPVDGDVLKKSGCSPPQAAKWSSTTSVSG